MKLSKGLIQAYDLRDLTHKLALELAEAQPDKELDKTSRAKEVAALVRAWAEADDHVRIHRGKPLPGTLRPVAKPKKSKSKTEPEPVTLQAIEPVAEQAKPSVEPMAT
jgi:hypothetical protein